MPAYKSVTGGLPPPPWTVGVVGSIAETNFGSVRNGCPGVYHLGYPTLNVRWMDSSVRVLEGTISTWDTPRKITTYGEKKGVVRTHAMDMAPARWDSEQKCLSRIRHFDCRKSVVKAPDWSGHGIARWEVVRIAFRPAENSLM